MRKNHRWTPEQDALLLKVVEQLTPTRKSYMGTEIGVLGWWRSVAAELAVRGGPEVTARACESRARVLREMSEDELAVHLAGPEVLVEVSSQAEQPAPLDLDAAGSLALLREMLKELRQIRALVARPTQRSNQRALDL